MVDLTESPIWNQNIYQIGTTDPVTGGTPNKTTLAGVSNVPHLQLAERTQFLREALSAPVAYLGMIVSDQVFVFSTEGELVQNQTGTSIVVAGTSRASLVGDGFTDMDLSVPALGNWGAPLARAFPHIETPENRFALSINSGVVLIEAGQPWLWRNGRRFTTSNFSSGERSFEMQASRHYHLRWHAPGTNSATPIENYPSGRFVLSDVTTEYNETRSDLDPSLDTTFDDMLIARISTNASNGVSESIRYINAIGYRDRIETSQVFISFPGNAVIRSDTILTAFSMNPVIIPFVVNTSTATASTDDDDYGLTIQDKSREGFTWQYLRDYAESFVLNFEVRME